AFGHVDAAIVRAVDAVQREHGVGGDILQIGARYGESTVLLGYLRQDGECLVVCDVFDGDGWYGDLRREFESTYLTFHDELPTVLQCSSTQLGSAGLRRTFRLVHVAGSTEFSIVSSDIAKAKELLVEGGVAVIDNLGGAHLGVAAAAWGEVAVGGFIPIGASASSLYATCSTSTAMIDAL